MTTDSLVSLKSPNAVERAEYTPPWANTSIVGIAGSSGSGKTSLALAIVAQLNLPWVVILSMDSFYKVLTPDQSACAFRNEFDFDAPEAIDFDVLVDRLRDIKAGRKAEIPIYSFEKHSRLDKTTTIYSPHVLILEGIFALHDPRVLDMLDLKIFAEADADVCLSRRLLRDVEQRGRDIAGCMKQWFRFVKPNFHKYVEPQRHVADIIVPRGIENPVAIGMISDRVRKILEDKSRRHQGELRRLGQLARAEGEARGVGRNVVVVERTAQVRGMETLVMDNDLSREEFVFYFDRLVGVLVERAVGLQAFLPSQVETPQRTLFLGLRPAGEITAVVLLRGGGALEAGLRRVIPDCCTGRLLIQTHEETEEPSLHFRKLPPDIGRPRAETAGGSWRDGESSGSISSREGEGGLVLLLDSQLKTGGAALMAVRVLVDFGVPEEKIVIVCYEAPRVGLRRILSVYPNVRAVVVRIVEDGKVTDRWVERRYFGT
ncbi:uridine-cytidine kinase-like protein-like 1 [Eremomyces bilateralis CBS 781.70]|uniref:Uridine kinase n=1 Tax=Eremomyces bilateralis CBS 781.70 TaxID=1392243 RepID=A0A6G1GFI5_9PEZI|nr:uridine-cytidine kinase-like protein-like 1 [Eremomyces bilateralis CBS 781.70]KAF1816813.1 uridine-cytidine kinase-like protein-like 1 [Eremomyces bilateralis CBS 781.70]